MRPRGDLNALGERGQVPGGADEHPVHVHGGVGRGDVQHQRGRAGRPGGVGRAHKAAQPVDILPYADLRRLETARALATRPKLLLLDEPFAGLGAGEIEPLVQLIRRLHDTQGLTILIIEHKLREFMQLVSRVIAMDFGEIIAIGEPADIVRHPLVIESYIGKADHGIA